MFAMLLQEAFSRRISIEPRSLAVVKRGVCTFVEKARSLRTGGAQLGIVVNSDNELLSMPAGKERTGDCSMPMGVAKESEGKSFPFNKLRQYLTTFPCSLTHPLGCAHQRGVGHRVGEQRGRVCGVPKGEHSGGGDRGSLAALGARHQRHPGAQVQTARQCESESICNNDNSL
jgi:hypothetical protein